MAPWWFQNYLWDSTVLFTLKTNSSGHWVSGVSRMVLGEFSLLYQLSSSSEQLQSGSVFLGTEGWAPPFSLLSWCEPRVRPSLSTRFALVKLSFPPITQVLLRVFCHVQVGMVSPTLLFTLASPTCLSKEANTEVLCSHGISSDKLPSSFPGNILAVLGEMYGLASHHARWTQPASCHKRKERACQDLVDDKGILFHCSHQLTVMTGVSPKF